MASHRATSHIIEITGIIPSLVTCYAIEPIGAFTHRDRVLVGLIDKLEDIGVLALKDDPLTLLTVGIPYSEDPGRYHAFVRMQLEVGLIGGHIYGAFLGEVGPTNLVALSMWYEPGTEFMESEEEHGPWDAYMRDLLLEVKQWMDEIMLPRVNTLAVESFGDVRKNTMFQLQLLAVHPDFHRRGIGTVLCKHEIEKNDLQVDTMGVSSCLETNSEDNIKFYKSLGFVVKGSVLMPPRLGDFTMTCIHRPPTTSECLL